MARHVLLSQSADYLWFLNKKNFLALSTGLVFMLLIQIMLEIVLAGLLKAQSLSSQQSEYWCQDLDLFFRRLSTNPSTMTCFRGWSKLLVVSWNGLVIRLIVRGLADFCHQNQFGITA